MYSVRSRWWILGLAVSAATALMAGCSIPRLPTPHPSSLIEETDPDEQPRLVKDFFLSSGSIWNHKKTFRKDMEDVVVLYFVPSNEPPRYVSKTVWYDPMDIEYSAKRQTHDLQEESKTGEQRDPKGTRRSHSVSVRALHDHKPGLWKVELFLDDVLARRKRFSVE
ncbi:MAG: hypothetical protein AB1646_09180 [Thermodesulfobacteriota bacterium]